MSHIPFRIGQFNVLCPTYGVKWGEREACRDWKCKDEHGGSNWEARWPAILRILAASSSDVLALQEVEESVRPVMEESLRSIGLELAWFSHPGRADAVGTAFKTDEFSLNNSASRDFPRDDPKATSGRVDLCHRGTGLNIRCVSTHQRGGKEAQLADTFEFACEDAPSSSVTIVCGDFNEDFGPAFEPFGFRTLDRNPDVGEPVVSRPAHKQGPENSSGKGKVDYIFVEGCEERKVFLERAEESAAALHMSHAECAETGEWPSDHGMEALQVVIVATVGPGVFEEEGDA